MQKNNSVTLFVFSKIEKIQDLVPCDSRLSFYNKAKVEHYREGYLLLSYGTPVMFISKDTRQSFVLIGWFSATTLRHIASFVACFGDQNTPRNKHELYNSKCCSLHKTPDLNLICAKTLSDDDLVTPFHVITKGGRDVYIYENNNDYCCRDYCFCEKIDKNNYTKCYYDYGYSKLYHAKHRLAKISQDK